jgi:hypothetical protein
MGPLLAEMAATAPMGGPKLEPSAPIPLDNTGKGTLDESSLGIVLMGWNNLLSNVGNLLEEMSSHKILTKDSIEQTVSRSSFGFSIEDPSECQSLGRQDPTPAHKDWRCA